MGALMVMDELRVCAVFNIGIFRSFHVTWCLLRIAAMATALECVFASKFIAAITSALQTPHARAM